LKNITIASIALLFASVSFAAKPVKLDMNLTLNGKTSHPKVVTNLGEAATISMVEKNGNGYEMTVLPIEIESQGKQAVKLEFKVSKIENNQKTEVSQPRVIAVFGEQARITQSGKDSFDLSVVPTL
jgi:hypothetical protein